MADRKFRKHDKKRLPVRLPLWLYLHYSERAYQADTSMQKIVVDILQREAEKSGAKNVPSGEAGKMVN